MDKAYGATADETNPFSKAEMGEAQDVKPVLAPVFVQPLRSRAKRRRRLSLIHIPSPRDRG